MASHPYDPSILTSTFSTASTQNRPARRVKATLDRWGNHLIGARQEHGRNFRPRALPAGPQFDSCYSAATNVAVGGRANWVQLVRMVHSRMWPSPCPMSADVIGGRITPRSRWARSRSGAK